MGKGALSEGKVAGLGVDHSIPSTAEVTNDYSFTSIYPYPLCYIMACYWVTYIFYLYIHMTLKYRTSLWCITQQTDGHNVAPCS